MSGEKDVPLPKRVMSPWLPVGLALTLLIALTIVVPSVAVALQLWLICVFGVILVALSLRDRRRRGLIEPLPPAPTAPTAAEGAPAVGEVVPGHAAPVANIPPPPADVPTPPLAPESSLAHDTPGGKALAPGQPADEREVFGTAGGGRWSVLTDAEAAGMLRVDQATIITAIKGGELPGNRIGVHWRIRGESLLTWLDGIYEPPRRAERKP